MSKDNANIFNNEFAGSTEQLGELSLEDEEAIEKALRNIAAQMAGSPDDNNSQFSDNAELNDDVEFGDIASTGEENVETISDSDVVDNFENEEVLQETPEDFSDEPAAVDNIELETAADIVETDNLVEDIKEEEIEIEKETEVNEEITVEEKIAADEENIVSDEESIVKEEVEPAFEAELQEDSIAESNEEKESDAEIEIEENKEIEPSEEQEKTIENNEEEINDISQEESIEESEKRDIEIKNTGLEAENDDFAAVDELDDDGVVKKYIVYISKDFVPYIDKLSIDERSAYINDAIQQKIDMLDEENLVLERKKVAAHIIIAAAIIIILLPFTLFIAHKSIMATFENYKYSQDSFEKLYRQRFKQDNAYLRSLEYNKEYEKRVKNNKDSK